MICKGAAKMPLGSQQTLYKARQNILNHRTSVQACNSRAKLENKYWSSWCSAEAFIITKITSVSKCQTLYWRSLLKKEDCFWMLVDDMMKPKGSSYLLQQSS